MIGLVRSEVMRFTSRRLFRFIALVVVAGLVAAAVIAFVQSSKDPDAGRAAAQRDYAQCKADEARAQADAPPGSPRVVFGCGSVEELTRAYDKRFVYTDTIPDASRGVALALFLLALIVASSFVGADWGTGAMTTLLTWEPRRGRVFAAKIIAASLLLALGAALTLAILAVVFLPVAALRGTLDGVDGSMWWTLAGIWLRGSAIAVFAACIGGSIATVTRNSVGAVGIAFGYGIVLEQILSAIRGGRLQPWLLQYLFAKVVGVDVDLGRGAMSNLRPMVLLTIYGVAVLAAAYTVFRLRDVT